MKTREFNQNYTIDRTARGIKALPKHAPTVAEIKTADGTNYDANQTYYFFDEQGREIRSSIGLREKDGYLSTFGLKVVPVLRLRSNRNDALCDGQEFFKMRMEDLQKSIENFELEKEGIIRE